MFKLLSCLSLCGTIFFSGCKFIKKNTPNLEIPKMKEPTSVHWYMKEQYAEIDFDDFGLVIEEVNSHFTETLAINLSMNHRMASSSQLSTPSRTLLQKHNAIIAFYEYPQHPHNRRPHPSTLTTMAEVVEDIISKMSADDKVNVRSKTKDELIGLNFGWGQGIRNHYQLWHNDALMKVTGKDHPKDASLVIIEEVWKQLQNADDTDIYANDYTVSLQWYVDKECLEISWGRGKSIVLAGIDLDFSEAFAKELGLTLIHTRMLYVHPDVRARVIQSARDVTLKLVKKE